MIHDMRRTPIIMNNIKLIRDMEPVPASENILECIWLCNYVIGDNNLANGRCIISVSCDRFISSGTILIRRVKW